MEGRIPAWLEPEEADLLLRPLRKWLELEGHNGEIGVFPYPAGLSSKWVAAHPECGGRTPVSDFDLKNDLSGVKERAIGLTR